MTKRDKTVLIDGLKKLAADVAEIAAALEDAKATEKAADTAPKAEQATPPEKTYTYEEVRAALAEKARAGFRAEVKALLAAYGMKKLSDAADQPEVYAVMMAEAEGIGNG